MPDIAHIFYSLTFLRKKTFQRKIYSSEVSFESTQKVDIYWNMNQPTKMYTNHTEYVFSIFLSLKAWKPLIYLNKFDPRNLTTFSSDLLQVGQRLLSY